MPEASAPVLLRLLLAPNHAPSCPKLWPASANQPLGCLPPIWPFAFDMAATARAHFSMRSRKRARLASAPTASRSAARLPLYLVRVTPRPTAAGAPPSRAHRAPRAPPLTPPPPVATSPSPPRHAPPPRRPRRRRRAAVPPCTAAAARRGAAAAAGSAAAAWSARHLARVRGGVRVGWVKGQG
eukprot:scaffold67481_cov57-Phaeocystis_antarctica.AAC.1